MLLFYHDGVGVGAGARGWKSGLRLVGAGGFGDKVRAQAGFPVGWRVPPLLE